MARASIRIRLTLWYSAVLLLGLLLFGGGLWFAIGQRLTATVDARLMERAGGLRTVIEIEGPFRNRAQLQQELSEFTREVAEGDLIQLRDSSGQLLTGSPSLPSVPGSDGPEYRTVAAAGRSLRVLTIRIHHDGRDYEVVAASSLDSVNAMLRELRTLLLLMIPVVLAIACLGGYWISGRALAPVDEITRAARSITVENLSRRLPVPKSGDEIQRLSEAWNEVLQRLERAVQRIRQFTADASHELRSPLAIIRATAELALHRERTPEQYRKSLAEIQAEAGRMTELAESLLALARSDAASSAMPLDRVDLNELVLQLGQQTLAVAAAKEIDLRIRTSGKAAIAPANVAAMRRLLFALVDNALKHTPRGGIVTLSCSERDGGIVLGVEDTGEGIPADALPHIFERFYRLDTARTSGSGAGLGLAIAQSIAEAHGSRIAVQSAPGQGARFELVLRNV
jgi:heavy metal sensor kinase